MNEANKKILIYVKNGLFNPSLDDSIRIIENHNMSFGVTTDVSQSSENTESIKMVHSVSTETTMESSLGNDVISTNLFYIEYDPIDDNVSAMVKRVIDMAKESETEDSITVWDNSTSSESVMLDIFKSMASMIKAGEGIDTFSSSLSEVEYQDVVSDILMYSMNKDSRSVGDFIQNISTVEKGEISRNPSSITNFTESEGIDIETPLPQINTEGDVYYTQATKTIVHHICTKLGIYVKELTFEKLDEFFKCGCANHVVHKPTTQEEEIVETHQPAEPEVNTEEPTTSEVSPAEIIEDISDEDVESYIGIEAKGAELHADRALTLVKDLNNKWGEIYPTIVNKLENISFFKDNVNKYVPLREDNIEKKVSKVVGGLVHIELLHKNLSQWDETSTWIDDHKNKIKKSQNRWKKEFGKFRASLVESIIPVIANLISGKEKINVVETKDSIDIVISDSNVRNSATESMEESIPHNVGETFITLASLESQVNSDDELFKLCLSTENLQDRDEIITKMKQVSIYGGTEKPLDLDISIDREILSASYK